MLISWSVILLGITLVEANRNEYYVPTTNRQELSSSPSGNYSAGRLTTERASHRYKVTGFQTTPPVNARRRSQSRAATPSINGATYHATPRRTTFNHKDDIHSKQQLPFNAKLFTPSKVKQPAHSKGQLESYLKDLEQRRKEAEQQGGDSRQPEGSKVSKTQPKLFVNVTSNLYNYNYII